jgi:hypothetical protein
VGPIPFYFLRWHAKKGGECNIFFW